MKRIDRLIVGELVGPWVFGVGLFTALLFAGGILNKLTSYFVAGAPTSVIFRLILLAVPAIMVKTFSMSMLLSGLLGFGRLSSDSELVALKAGGASIPRILRPVMLASLLVAFVTFGFNELVVPRAARAGVALMASLVREGKVGGTGEAHPIVQKGKVAAFLGAKKVDLATGEMQHVSVVAIDDEGNPTWLLDAPHARYRPPSDWRIEGSARLVPIKDPRAVVQLRGGAWPLDFVPQPVGTLEDLLDKKEDYDSYTLSELRTKIAQMRREGNRQPSEVNDYEYGYYNKFSVALAALVFGTLGAVLGIRNHRTGTASGFALAVGIIFGYIAIANFMNEWAKGGLLPPWVSSFAPLCIGAVACGVIIYRRNT